MQAYDVLGGIHSAGSRSLFDWLTLSVTAMSCGRVRSLANDWRCAVVQLLAPDCQASASGTTCYPPPVSCAAHIIDRVRCAVSFL